MAERSKAVDLSSIIFGCAGSNPAGDIFYAPVAKWLRRPPSKRKIVGSIPTRGFYYQTAIFK